MREISDKLKDWKVIKAELEMVRITRGTLQRHYFDLYLEKKNAYELKYSERFNMLSRPSN